MGVATWDFAVTDLPTDVTAAAVLDFLDKPTTCRYIRRRNGYCEMELDIVNDDDVAVIEGAGFRRMILAYRNGVERFWGTIVESHETQDGYTIGARDPYYNLSWRRIPLEETNAAGFVHYTAVGDAEIAARLIDMQNDRWPFWLDRGTIISGSNR